MITNTNITSKMVVQNEDEGNTYDRKIKSGGTEDGQQGEHSGFGWMIVFASFMVQGLRSVVKQIGMDNTY